MFSHRSPSALASGLTLLLIAGCTEPGPRGQVDRSPEKTGELGKSPIAARSDPGSHHRHLDSIRGRWKSTITVWPRPGAEGNRSEGISELQWILDGRWLRQDYRASDASEGAAMGLGLIGYDYVREEHVYVWVDNMSYSALQAAGPCDGGGRTAVLVGSHGDPSSGERDRPFRWVIRTMNEDRWTLELYDTAPDGTEFRKLEIDNNRASAQPIPG